MAEGIDYRAELYKLLEREAELSAAIILLQHQQVDLADKRKLTRNQIETLRMGG